MNIFPLFVDCKTGNLSYDCDASKGCWHSLGLTKKKEKKAETTKDLIAAEYYKIRHRMEVERMKPIIHKYTTLPKPTKTEPGAVRIVYSCNQAVEANWKKTTIANKRVTCKNCKKRKE